MCIRDSLFPCGSGIEHGLGHLSDVPQLRQEKIEVDLLDSLPLKQKLAPLWLWRKEVHQLLFWVGSSRPSEKCAKKNQAWFQRAFDLLPPRLSKKAWGGR